MRAARRPTTHDSASRSAGLRVLMVEDNPGDARLIQELIAEQSAAGVSLRHATRLSEALDVLGGQAYDAVLLDLFLPGESQGLDTLAAVQARAPNAPILVLSGLNDEAVAIEAVHRGAQDYLVKGDVDARALVRSIRYAVERQRMATELEASRQTELELKDRFLSHVSHELRSPLSAIYQFVTLLLDGVVGDMDEAKRDLVQVVLRNTEHLRTMIEDLLEVTRAQTGKLVVRPVWMDITATLRSVAATYRPLLEGRGLTLGLEISPGLPRIHGDPARVQQVLTNFLDNAAKHTPQGGRIEIRAHEERENDAVRVEVEDTGCGIEAGQQRHVFERLHQAGPGPTDGKAGLGLGLYICRLLVARQGGRIGLSSQPEVGSTFWFTLPSLSVSHVVAPVLLAEGVEGRDELVLLKIGVERAEGGELGESHEHALEEFWEVLERCSLPDLDALFPRGLGGPGRAVFFVALLADEAGAEVVVRRILRQARTIQGFGGGELVPVFERSSVSLGSSAMDGEGVAAVAREVERLINAFLDEGAPHMGRSPT